MTKLRNKAYLPSSLFAVSPSELHQRRTSCGAPQLRGTIWREAC